MKLTLLNVNKTIKKKVILKDICAEFESGVVYGIVGRNGSGKTMLFRAVSGLINIDSGKILLDGKELHRDMDVLPSLGMILENADLFPDLNCIENLEYLAGIKKTATKEDVIRAIERVGLDPDDKRSYRKYSLGMKQRLKIAQAVMEKPDVLILDEPTNGIDEAGVELVRKIVKEEKERGALVLISSHNRADIDLLSDTVFQMKSGVMEPI